MGKYDKITGLALVGLMSVFYMAGRIPICVSYPPARGNSFLCSGTGSMKANDVFVAILMIGISIYFGLFLLRNDLEDASFLSKIVAGLYAIPGLILVTVFAIGILIALAILLLFFGILAAIFPSLRGLFSETLEGEVAVCKFVKNAWSDTILVIIEK